LRLPTVDAAIVIGAYSNLMHIVPVRTYSDEDQREQFVMGPWVAPFLRSLEGQNASSQTLKAYRIDLAQCFAIVAECNGTVHTPAQLTRGDIEDYLAELARRHLSGVTRARKLAAVRMYFRYLVSQGLLVSSPTEGVATPKKEKRGKTALRPDEYSRLLALAGSNPRDYAILQVFLQTGVRVSELVNLRLDDIDLIGKTLTVTQGKGQQARIIALEKKASQAIRTYLAVRGDTLEDHLFLNQYGEFLRERGVRKLVAKYLEAANITKSVSCHGLRKTFATYKAARGVSPYQLMDWLGHKSIATTQLYVQLGKQDGHKVMEATSL
jgi:site-specific recombinase XerD